MAIKLRFALPLLIVIVSLGSIGIAQAAPVGPTEILEVDIDYDIGRLTIEGTGFDDGTFDNNPIVTLGGYLLTNVIFTHFDPTIGPDTIQGDIDLASLFPVTGDYLLIVDPNFKRAKTAELLLTIQGSTTPAHPSGNTGDIIGSVEICDLLGIDQVIVYIPGRSFVVRPASDGIFEMNFVPPGSYDLFIQAYDGEVVSTISGVVVNDKQQTDLGVVTVCIDADVDGYDATEDCNDADPNIYPGAPELCNAIDDNCDGTIDDGLPNRDYWRDRDNDSYGDSSDTFVACTTPPGYVYPTTEDCYDYNRDARPNQPQSFNYSRGDGSYDYNCDTVEEVRWIGGPKLCVVSGLSCVTEGSGVWAQEEPACGEVGEVFSSCNGYAGPFPTPYTCETITSSERQACR